MTEDRVLDTGRLMLDLSEDEIDELRSWVFLSFSRSLFLLLVTVSYTLKSSTSSSLLLAASDLESELLFMSLSYRLFPHRFSVLKWDFLVSGESFLLVARKRSVLLLRHTAPASEGSVSWLSVGEDASSLSRNGN